MNEFTAYNIVISVIIGVLQIVDVYLTIKIVSAGGKELNKLLEWLMNKIGVRTALILTKGAVILLLGASLFWIASAWTTAFLYTMVALAYLWVVFHNYGEWKKFP